jgi:hypothetical protein
LHPDQFILDLINSDQDAAIAALRRLRQSLRTPPVTSADLLATMKRHGLTESANAISGLIDAL